MRARGRLLPFALLLAGVNLLAAGEALREGLPARPPAPAADAHSIPRAVVLVFDGVAFDLLEEYLATGRLPHLAALAREGCFHPLRSEIPPESPVALASLLTGVNPGRHGIFDFVVRGEGYEPENGMVAVRRPRLLLGRVPVRPPQVRSRLAAPTFPELVHAAGYPVLSLQQPLLFPVAERPGAHLTAGLGTPDLAGSAGFYTVYSDRLGTVEGPTTFGGWRVALKPGAPGVYDTVLLGPQDPTAPTDRHGGAPRVGVPLRLVRRDGGVTIRLAGREEDVPLGQRSGWFPVAFEVPLLPFSRTVRGLVRFEVKELEPLRVLASPVSMDPADPPFALSSPPGYAQALAEVYGLGPTLGWREETFQVNDRNQDDAAFLRHLLEDMDMGAARLLGEMRRRDPRLVLYTFTAPDRAFHVFWRYRDANHPLAGTRDEAVGADPIGTVLERVDAIVGKVRATLKPRDLLLVASDHGFATWRWGVNVNQWLVDHGYLTLRAAPGARSLHGFFGGRGTPGAVDWSRTRAYAMGLGQVYLNRVGREPEGIVTPAEAPALLDELRAGLLALRHPLLRPEDAADGMSEQPIVCVWKLHETFEGPLAAEAPDLQLGFARGYRVSWQTALLGGMRPGGETFVLNDVPWSGDHCSCDPAIVMGVLLANRRLGPAPPGRPYHVRDVAATALAHFGLDRAHLAGDSEPLPFEAAP